MKSSKAYSVLSKIATVTGLCAALSVLGINALKQSNAFDTEPPFPGTGHILVLNSYHPGFEGTQESLEVIRKTFGKNYRVDEVFLDTKNHSPEKMFPLNRDLLAGKYEAGDQPDIIIAFDDNAVIFADWHRGMLFPNAPIVFAGVNSKDRVLAMSSNNNATGVHESTSVIETVDLAKTLNKAPLERIRVIADKTPTSQAVMGRVALADYQFADIDFETIWLNEVSFAELKHTVSSETRADTAFLFAGAYKDKNGSIMKGDDFFQMMSISAGRPVYALLQRSVRSGAAGGFVGSKIRQTEEATNMAKLILSGTPADEIAPILNSPNFAMISEPQAKRYDLHLEALPEGAVIHDKMPGFWEARQNTIMLIMITASVMGAITFLFHFSNLRVQRGLKQVNDQLQERNEDLEHAKIEIERQSLHDALTGLPNRRYAEREIHRRVCCRDASKSAVALFFLDLDDFKPINDTSGHHAGDHVLNTISKRLRIAMPKDAFVARIGGDEFIVIADVESEAHILSIGQNLIDVSKNPIRFESNVYRLSASVGVVSTICTDAIDPKELLRRADIALYRAKEEGKGGIALFENSDLERLYQEKELSDDITRAVEQSEFIPYFQPQVSMRTGRVVGVEALARWDHPKHGILAPVAFVEMAERIGVLAEIDRMILEKACDIMKVWRASGIDIPRLSVNVSAKRLSDSTLIDQIEQLDLSGTILVFELLESIYLDNADGETKRNISRLRKMGVEIEVDDFGTGHASIVAVMNLKPKKLKIAREFIAPIDNDEGTARIVRNLIEMAKNMDVGIIAEGVETVSHMVKLDEMGCDIVQGYGVKPPVPADQIPGFVYEYEQQTNRLAS